MTQSKPDRPTVDVQTNPTTSLQSHNGNGTTAKEPKTQDTNSIIELAGTFGGEAWEDLLKEIERNRQQEAQEGAE